MNAPSTRDRQPIPGPLALCHATIPSLVAALFLSLLPASPAAATPAAQAGSEDDQRTVGAGATAEQTPRSGPRRDRLEQRMAATRSIWWNEAEVVESLGLTEAQRSAADQHLAEFMDRKETLDGEELRETQAELRQALAERRWDDARKMGERLSIVRGRPFQEQLELMIAVLSELTPEQVDQLQEERPHLLRRPWVRQVRLGGPGPGAPSQR